MTTRRPSHRRPAPALRRARQAILAGAVSIATVGVSAGVATAHDNVWDRVAECESSGRWDINTGNGFYGGLQFWQPTWIDFGGQSYAPYAHQASKLQQIEIAQEVLKVQGPGAWPVCSVRAGLTVENGLQPYPGDGGGGGSSSSADTWRVTASRGANIRSGPGMSYQVVGGAGYNTTVTGTLSNGWVKLADGRGYISGSILDQSGGSGESSSSEMAPLVIDGSRGPLTVKAIQRWVGISETGRWDTTTIEALQAQVGTGVDGLWGPKSQAALQNYIGMPQDGSTYMNYPTVVSLQKWLNANVIG